MVVVKFKESTVQERSLILDCHSEFSDSCKAHAERASLKEKTG
jgi:hypothetical protein